ncbi:bifunctional proline dehydrogenase/L-glutamate gamma-semialdehyde dehydrogenase [Subtercola sp. PAMC28395]|uniref:bifunctional proline dehydrogenase/L-glutamate gamma-semialdehyde dehydrogenase n=1 Tax=Subtercola sp. PAMC28395 TaxID=2846775 RepID=UPI001C0C1DBF|nr:bifunctional proline dehydrogenase/L-glutamate gamma-semialdehyde dehydrogenase [Subtercola sp. PAMC28395]QWT24585.1 bifunctional proline dehydrogenase/L-glutamate gamma-semialdehyde dehydrogenase [Subtercola sp. PAMC28395]
MVDPAQESEVAASGPGAAPDDLTGLREAATALVRRWLSESADTPVDESAARLAGVLKDPNGLAFTVGFVDGVARPDDPVVAGKNLADLAGLTPQFLPPHLRNAIKLGGALGEALPWVVVPTSKGVLRRMVGHLIADASPAKLGKAIAALTAEGVRLNINLLGEAVLGDREAQNRLSGTLDLLARDDVDYISVKVSAIAAELSLWAFDETVERVANSLVPLYALALQGAKPAKFINLDMEEYADLDLTIAVFQNVLGRPEFTQLEAGIVLQAYLPDALQAMRRLQAWAAARVADGGAPIKVRLVKGANLAMERVDSITHGWPLATWGSKEETDTNYKRVLDWALTPERVEFVKVGVAGHNLFDIAFAWLLAERRGVTKSIDFEMLLGMAAAQADAVRRHVGGLLLYTPVVHPREFTVAINYLVRRLEENASDENFMSAVFDIGTDAVAFERERARFAASLAVLEAAETTAVPLPRRTQNRADPEALEALPRGVFVNTPDTDPSLPANRDWARAILKRVESSTLGEQTLEGVHYADPELLDGLLERVAAAGRAWGAQPAEVRAAALRRAGLALEANRDLLLEVMASETGKTIAEGDPEVSEAVDFAHYYSVQATELERVDGATFVPPALVIVAPPWNFPVSIPAGGVLAALAAGAGVVFKPAPQARRCAAVIAESLWQAGIPTDLLALIDIDEAELGSELITHPLVDRVILTGSFETAALFRSWRHDLPLLAETSGKNAIIVTPSADLDLAAADVVKSAFGHAGQKCSAASLVILVGSVGRSARFRKQLVDAVTSLRVGYPADATTQLGPVIEPASGKLLDALATLGPGESWLVEPRALDETGRLWTPGVRTGVAAGSAFHLTEYFGPVLGIMHAPTLAAAVELQNASEFGLTAGIHSLDADEIEYWLAGVQAGNLYVNRGITGAIVQRQPFGGWKRSSVGAGAKAGGPNYLLQLGRWVDEPGEAGDDISLAGLEPKVAELLEASTAGLDYKEFEVVRRAAVGDEEAWAGFFAPSDASALGVERNVLRYRPVPVVVRLSEGQPFVELVRVLAAATRAGAPVTISTALKLPRPLRALLKERAVRVFVEDDAGWLARAAESEAASRAPAGAADSRVADNSGAPGLGMLVAGPVASGSPAGHYFGASFTVDRIRMIGGDPRALAAALGGTPDVAVYAGDVTRAPRIELLPFLREQSVSMTNHRFGNPSSLLPVG